MLFRNFRWLAATSLLALAPVQGWAQSPIPRPTPVAGAIVSAKGGEEMRLTRSSDWQAALLRQDVVGGDALRTNAIGTLGLLFVDQTQIRVGRNSTLVVNEVSSGPNNTQLELQGGQVWARANRGGAGVDVKTPAAVAAIRGTDWSLSVDRSGKTSLIVLEGVVELSNAQGSVTVRQGEGAVAAIGQAPTKFVLVNSNDREQMLFYLTLRDAFTWLPATALQGPALRAERARIASVPPEGRRAEDWLSLAEAALALDGRAAAASALQEARRQGLGRGQAARAALVEALLAGGAGQWAEAARLFAQAERGLDPRRRVTAAYGRYVAASLADPRRVQPEPRIGGNDPTAALARIFITGFRQDLKAAADVAAEAQRRHPGDARLAAFATQVALGLNRREEMRASLDRARALDPGDPTVLLTSAVVRSEIESDLNGSLAELRQAASIAPGQAQIWNQLGLVESARDAPLEAEAAFRRAIEADPADPVAYANLAIHLLDQSRVDEAGALIDQALAIDPAFHVAYIARGRYLLQKGESAGAIESILAGSAANPGLSQGLLAAAIAYYQNGEHDLADQALDNADRLDPNDPVVAIARTAFALDQYEGDRAILNAREALKRYRARGGFFAPLAVNRQGGSYVAGAYRFLGLGEWARFYGDRVFDPFDAAGYFDQAIARRPRLFFDQPPSADPEGFEADLTAFNLVMQGLLLDPLAASGRIGRTDLLRRPFLDVEVGGGLRVRDGEVGWQAEATVQGFVNNPVPTAFSLNAARVRDDGPATSDRDQSDTASFFVGLAPSAADRFLIFGAASHEKPGLINARTEQSAVADARDTTAAQIGAGWSHSFGFRNVLSASVYATRSHDKRYEDRLIDFFPIFATSTRQLKRATTEGAVAAVNHMVGFGDFTFRYGAEVQGGDTKASAFGRIVVVDYLNNLSERTPIEERAESSFRAGRLYGDVLWRPADWFEAQAGLHRTVIDVKGEAADTALSPRVGVGVSPFEGQWLRAAYRREAELPLPYTLSPITTLGLVGSPIPLGLGGQSDTVAVRWDAEWTPRFFTSVEAQRQEARDLSLAIPETLDSYSIGKARIDWAAATANLWLGGGIGVFGTFGGTSSDIRSGEERGQTVPFVPERFARLGLTFVHPSRLKFTLTQNFIGERAGNTSGDRLDSLWTTDAALTWETPDRRLLLGLTVLNLFDERYEFAVGIPGLGRTVSASLKARF